MRYVPYIFLIVLWAPPAPADDCDPNFIEQAKALCSKKCSKEQCQAQAESFVNHEDFIKISEEAKRVEVAAGFENVLRPQAEEALNSLKAFHDVPGFSDSTPFSVQIDVNGPATEFKRLSPFHICFGTWLAKASRPSLSKFTEADTENCTGQTGFTLQEIEFTLDLFVKAIPKTPKNPVTLNSGPPPLPRELRDQKTVDRFIEASKTFMKEKKIPAVDIGAIVLKLKRIVGSLQKLDQNGVVVWQKTDESGTGNFIYRPLAGQSTRLDVWATAKGLNCLSPKGTENEMPALIAKLKSLAGSRGGRFPASVCPKK